MSFLSRFLAVALLIAPVLGCGGGGGSSRSAVPTATASPTAAPTSTPTGTVTPAPTGASTPTPTAFPTATATATATSTPTATPLPRLSTPIPLIEGRRMGDDYFAAPATTGQTIGADSCDVSHYDYHIHSHLSIFLDGRQLAVPAAIGIKNPRFETSANYPDGFAIYGDCVYGLHTHDTSGKLHVEGEVKRVFTLGEVFAIWGVPLSYENFAGITGRPVVVYLNDSTNTGGAAGKSNLRLYSGDLASLELMSKREITVQIGSRISSVPTYIWYGEDNQNGHHDELSEARVRALKSHFN